MKLPRIFEFEYHSFYEEDPSGIRVKHPRWYRDWKLRKLRKKTPVPVSNYRFVDMSDIITELEPDTSQFTAMLMSLGEAKVQWIEPETSELIEWPWPKAPKCAS